MQLDLLTIAPRHQNLALQPQELDPDYEAWRATHFETIENRVILSLFDHSGEWSKPYRAAGYTVIAFDIKEHAGPGVYVTHDIADFSAEYLTDTLGLDHVYGILAAPPCTHFTASGAQYWEAKDATGQTEEMLHLVRQVIRAVDLFAPIFWAMENPVGRLQKLLPGLGNPWYFQPHQFGDAYTKKTGLWGDFSTDLDETPVEPVKASAHGSWLMSHGGKSEATKAARSVTPQGFARAFFKANQ